MWGFIPSHSFALPKYEMWLPGLVLARTFANPCLGRKLKVWVTTKNAHTYYVEDLKLWKTVLETSKQMMEQK
jgi:hypothetical protein